MSHKRSGSPLAKMRLRAKLDQDAVAKHLGIAGGKSVFSQYEVGRLLLPAGHVAPLAALYRTTQKRVAWCAVLTFRRGITMTRYSEMVKKAVDYTREKV